MSRLPVPGQDSGQWGGILNDFLSQAHTPDGKLKTDSVTAAQLAPGSVKGAAIADGAITSSKLDPTSQASLAKAEEAVQNDDYRLSNPRVPTKHASSHKQGGSDPIEITTVSGVTLSGTPTPGQVPVATSSNTATWQTPVGQSGVVVLNAGDPDPSPPIDGVLYLRLTGSVLDTTPPTVPANLRVGIVTDTSIQAAWDPSTDNAAVSAYQIRLNGGTPIVTSNTTYTFTSLTASTAYTIDVQAGDAAGNWSSWTTALSVTTNAPGAAIFSDDFNRAGGPAGNGWTSDAGTSSVSILFNSLAVSGWSGYGRAYQSNMPRNTSVRADFTGGLPAFQGIFLAHDPSTGTGIKLFSDNGTWSIGNSAQYYANNTPVSFVNTPTTPYTSLRLDFDGTTITAYINGVVVHTMAASSLGFTVSANTNAVYQIGYCGEAKQPYMDTFSVYAA